MFPGGTLPAMQGNIYERRTHSIATQLQRGKQMKIDYDQLPRRSAPAPGRARSPGIRTDGVLAPLAFDPATCTCAGSPSTTAPRRTVHAVPRRALMCEAEIRKHFRAVAKPFVAVGRRRRLSRAARLACTR